MSSASNAGNTFQFVLFLYMMIYCPIYSLGLIGKIILGGRRLLLSHIEGITVTLKTTLTLKHQRILCAHVNSYIPNQYFYWILFSVVCLVKSFYLPPHKNPPPQPKTYCGLPTLLYTAQKGQVQSSKCSVLQNHKAIFLLV